MYLLYARMSLLAFPGTISLDGVKVDSPQCLRLVLYQVIESSEYVTVAHRRESLPIVSHGVEAVLNILNSAMFDIVATSELETGWGVDFEELAQCSYIEVAIVKTRF